MNKNYKINDLIVYHVVTELFQDVKIGDVINTPVIHQHLHDLNEFEESRPDFIKEERKTSLFVCLEEDIKRWAIECLPPGPQEYEKEYSILKLSLTGNLFWVDKGLYKIYFIEKDLHPNAERKILNEWKTEALKEYWDSCLTTDEVKAKEMNYRNLYEGLFFGEAIVIDKYTINIKYRG